MSNKGFLAIWCEIGQDDLQDYRNWITREHIADRIFSPGFLGVRFCNATNNDRAHFFLYITETPEVFQSPSYLHILNSPSSWTKRIMPKFGPFDRAAGEQLLKVGNGFGGYMAVSRIKVAGEGRVDLGTAKDTLQQFLELPDVVSVRLMRVERSTTDIKSQEKTMRSGLEGDFDYLVVVEAMSEGGAEKAAQETTKRAGDIAPGVLRVDASVRRVLYGEAPYEGPSS